MRVLGGLVLLCAAVVIGGAVIFNNPQLPGQAAAVAQHAADWVGGEIHQFTSAHPTPATPGGYVEPTGPAPVILHPSTSTATAAPTATPLFSAPAAPAAQTPAPTAIPTPAPTATATATPVPMVAGMPWSADEVTWAEGTLSYDIQLDTQAETDYQGGAFHDYYAAYAAKWTAVRSDIQTLAGGGSLSADTVAKPPQWFADAIAAHQADTLTTPKDASWNDWWIVQYQRLEADWAQLP